MEVGERMDWIPRPWYLALTPNPNSACMQQIGRNLTDFGDGFLLGSEYLLLDRDIKYLPLRGVL